MDLHSIKRRSLQLRACCDAIIHATFKLLLLLHLFHTLLTWSGSQLLIGLLICRLAVCTLLARVKEDLGAVFYRLRALLFNDRGGSMVMGNCLLRGWWGSLHRHGLLLLPSLRLLLSILGLLWLGWLVLHCEFVKNQFDWAGNWGQRTNLYCYFKQGTFYRTALRNLILSL